MAPASSFSDWRRKSCRETILGFLNSSLLFSRFLSLYPEIYLSPVIWWFCPSRGNIFISLFLNLEQRTSNRRPKQKNDKFKSVHSCLNPIYFALFYQLYSCMKSELKWGRHYTNSLKGTWCDKKCVFGYIWFRTHFQEFPGNLSGYFLTKTRQVTLEKGQKRKVTSFLVHVRGISLSSALFNRDVTWSIRGIITWSDKTQKGQVDFVPADFMIERMKSSIWDVNGK